MGKKLQYLSILLLFGSLLLTARGEENSLELRNSLNITQVSRSYSLETELNYQGQRLGMNYLPHPGEKWSRYHGDFSSLDHHLEGFLGLEIPLPLSERLILSFTAHWNNWFTFRSANTGLYYQGWTGGLAIFPMGETLGLMAGAGYDWLPHGGNPQLQGGVYWNPGISWDLNITALYPFYLGFELESPGRAFFLEVNLFEPRINLEFRFSDNWTVALEYLKALEYHTLDLFWEGQRASVFKLEREELHLILGYRITGRVFLSLDYGYGIQEGLFFYGDEELDSKLNLPDNHGFSLNLRYDFPESRE